MCFAMAAPASRGFQRGLNNGAWVTVGAGPSSGSPSPPPTPTLGEGLRNAAWILGSYGAAADGPGGQGAPPTSPPWPWWLCRQPLAVREGPFVYEDKEEIEKFLRAEWGLASMTMVTAWSSMQPLALGASLPLRRTGLGASWVARGGASCPFTCAGQDAGSGSLGQPAPS